MPFSTVHSLAITWINQQERRILTQTHAPVGASQNQSAHTGCHKMFDSSIIELDNCSIPDVFQCTSGLYVRTFPCVCKHSLWQLPSCDISYLTHCRLASVSCIVLAPLSKKGVGRCVTCCTLTGQEVLFDLQEGTYIHTYAYVHTYVYTYIYS